MRLGSVTEAEDVAQDVWLRAVAPGTPTADALQLLASWAASEETLANEADAANEMG